MIDTKKEKDFDDIPGDEFAVHEDWEVLRKKLQKMDENFKLRNNPINFINNNKCMIEELIKGRKMFIEKKRMKQQVIKMKKLRKEGKS